MLQLGKGGGENMIIEGCQAAERDTTSNNEREMEEMDLVYGGNKATHCWDASRAPVSDSNSPPWPKT
jgi:hypothetical protein